MKLLKLIVKNFRAFGAGFKDQGVTLEFNQNNIVFLIGPNNAGKSSLLEAYAFFVIAESLATESDFHRKAADSPPIEIEGWVLAETEEDQKHQAVRNWLDSSRVARFKKVWKQPGKPSKQSWDPDLGQWTDGGAGGWDTHLQNALPTPIWVRGLSTPVEAQDAIQSLVKTAVFARIKDTEPYNNAVTALAALQTVVSGDAFANDLQDLITDWIRPVFPNLKVKVNSEGDTDLTKILDKQTVVKLAEQGGPELSMDFHGHGVRRQLVLQVLRGLHDQIQATKAKSKVKAVELPSRLRESPSEKTKMLLIEEPELFLHPQGIRAVKDLLYTLADASEFQVVACTHSPVMIDLKQTSC